MKALTTEIRVGMAVLVALVMLAYMTFSVGGLPSIGEEGYRVRAVFHSAAGLDKKAPVQVAGVKVGHVETVALVEEGATVTMRIDAGVKIKKGGFASVRSSGFLGDRFVEIVPGQHAALLADGDQVASQDEGPGMEDLMNRFAGIADDVKAVTTALRAIFEDGTTQTSLDDILTHTRSLTKEIDDFVKNNKGSLARSVANIESFTKALRERGHTLIEEARELTQSLNQIAKKIERGEGTIGKLIQDEASYHKLNAALDDLGKALKGVEVITQKIEKGEGTVGKLFADDTAYENLNTALAGFGETLGRIERFKTYVGFKSEYPLRSEEPKGYFNLRVQPRADKYYLLGVVNDPRGEVTRTSRVVTVNGAPTTVTELETDRRMKFSAQFGKRMDRFDLRIGLVENTAGLGADYALWDDRLRISLDAWDFDSDDPEVDRAHLKFTTAYTLLKHISLEAGYDQVLNSNLDTFFFGLGIQFEDDDLKYLLGGLSGLAR